ncbi:MAG: hypothetical protein PVH88_22070 [Ignavibacteria bacterium]|jgi:hypothetical protein
MKFINIVFAFVLFSQMLFAQDLKAQKDSLEAYKESLKKIVEQTKKDISELRKKSDELDLKIKESQRELYVKKYGKEDGELVAMGRVWKGMNEQMLIDSWGKPDKKNTDKFSYGTFTQYYYGDITYFFRDGRLIDWEEGKESEGK